jgi:subtilisin family serine protease
VIKHTDSPIRIPVKPIKSIIDKLDSPVVYSPKSYGIMSPMSGNNVSIGIIDTGCPLHDDIKPNIAGQVNFTDESKTYHDDHGHSTMIAGVLAANNRQGVVGVAPEAKLFFGKVSKDGGDCDYNAIVAAILWSVVKKVDIILMSLGTQVDYTVLREAIKKAHAAKTCIIAADVNGNAVSPLYPASYDEVLSFRAKPKGKEVKAEARKGGSIFVPMSHSGMLTTFGKKEYTRAYGSSLAAAMGAGLVALIVEKYKEDKKDRVDPSLVYRAIQSLKIPS